MKPPEHFAEMRPIPTTVKRNHVWNPGLPCRKHGKRCYQIMIPLTVNEVPSPTNDDAIHVWRKAVVFVGRPGTHAANLHTIHILKGGKLTAQVCLPNSDSNARTR